MSKDPFPPVALEVVLDDERQEIEKVREMRGTSGKTGKPRDAAVSPVAPIAGKADAAEPAWQKDNVNWVNAVNKAHAANLVGLAFSGGGIRSATFNLGVLQALAQARLLRAFDYVSTVSGGGYIGSWLMAWMHHPVIGIQDVEDRLAPHGYSSASAADSAEVHFLRNYSNYLTPRKGILGADFW